MGFTVRPAIEADASTLASVAAATFPLACPPGTGAESMASFIREHLSEERMAEYLADPSRWLFLAESAGEAIGYTMLVLGEPRDVDVLSALTVRPTAEVSKCYVLADRHGSGVAAALLATTVDAAQTAGAVGAWLGVNQHNARANAFYERQGFRLVGTKHFMVGDEPQDDYVRERVFA